jgi:putative hydrolase of the HAD superfamily
VLFDFGGVLCFHPSQDRFRRVAEAAGLDFDRFSGAFWEHRLEYDAGRIGEREYWEGVMRACGAPFDPARLPALLRLEVELWNEFDERPLAWADQLRAQGLRTGVLSNLPKALGEALRATPGLLDSFDHLTFSYELRLAKPERAIYEHALRGLQVRPEEALFLDDRPGNVEGARNAGLRAELFSTWEEWIAGGAAARYGLPEPAVARRQ